MWDSGAAGDCSELNSDDADSQEGIEERDENEGDEFSTDPQEQPQNEPEICKSFYFLEECSFIDFVETDGEFIITAGRDHDIKVWDAAKEVIIRRFVGHIAPITGIKLQGADTCSPCSIDLSVISSSEDGSIRQWSLKTGTETKKIETDNIITCMDVMPNKLVAIGNHKGHLDLYQLSTGQLYCSIVAHDDPIDVLMINEVDICTAVYDRPGSLRVWQLKRGKIICMYCLEESLSIEFKTFTIYGDLLILGDGTEQKLHVLSYMMEDTTETLQLCENAGQVQHVTVKDGLVLASAVDNNKMVHLHVYQLQDFDHFGTFYCKNMDRISSIMLINIKNNGLKFILGGSALAVLKLEFSIRKDTTKVTSSSKPLNQTEVNLKQKETVAESIAACQFQDKDKDLLEDKNLNETTKSKSIRSNTAAHCYKKQLALESLSNLPTMDQSKKSKLQLKKGNQTYKQSTNENNLTENHNSYAGKLPDFKLKGNIKQNLVTENFTPVVEFDGLDLVPSHDQDDIQQMKLKHEKHQNHNDTTYPISSPGKFLRGETSENNTDTHMQKRITLEGMLIDPKLKGKIKQKLNTESVVPEVEFDRLEMDPSNVQGDIQHMNDLKQGKQQNYNETKSPISSSDKYLGGETIGNDTDKPMQERIPRTLTQKQKYESENVRIIKVNKQQKEGKKHNWFHFSKKKQEKCTEKTQQKNKGKDCMIM